MIMCIQNLVKFCPFVLKILSGNENYDGITELQNDRMTEGQTGQIQFSPPLFSKRGYKNPSCFIFITVFMESSLAAFLSKDTYNLERDLC